MTDFLPGLDLSQAFYQEAVRPILGEYFPRVVHSAALLGYGSDVLGFDTPISMDHEWGPRLLLFLAEDDYAASAQHVHDALAHNLPVTFRGFSTNFSAGRIQRQEPMDTGPVNHKVRILTVRGFVQETLGVDPDVELRPVDWLTFPQQRLLEITRGRLFHDGLGDLARLRSKFRAYPPDVRLYLLASQWAAISQEEAFMGRCAAVGDALGERVIAARMVQMLMRLCFLMEQQYAPYSKWFGTAFARLACAAQLTGPLQGILSAASWQEREAQLVEAYGMVARMHNGLGLTEPLETGVERYYGRPYLVLYAERFAEAIRAQIRDPAVLAWPANLGGVDQVIKATDLLVQPKRCRAVQALYQ